MDTPNVVFVNCTGTARVEDGKLIVQVKPVLGPVRFLVAVLGLAVALVVLFALGLAIPALLYALSVTLL